MKKTNRGLPCIFALFLLTALLSGCSDAGESGGGGEVLQKFFAGRFEGNGQIELFVQGLPLTNQRSLARSLMAGSEIIAHLEHDELKLRLEGAYDRKSDGFVLSARTDDFVYSVFGQLDFNGDFQFAEISVTHKENDEWKMRSHLIDPDPLVTLAEDGFSKGLGGVSSGLAGNVEAWVPWFREDENFRRWAMISPAAMVEYELDPEKGFPEETYRYNFVNYEGVSANEANVIVMSNNPTWESMEAAFPPIDGEGHIDDYGNVHYIDAMYSAVFGKPMAGWGDLDRYYEENVFNAAAVAYIQQNKAAITAAFEDRDEWAKEYGSGIWWFDSNMILTELWDEWLDREEVVQSDPDNPWYVPGWDRDTEFAQRQANGEVITVDGVHYKVWWDWSFKNKPFNTWRDNLTQAQWEQIQNSTGKVFPDYIWKYRRDLTSYAYQESFLLSKGVVFTQSYQRYRIGKNAYGTTTDQMGTTSSWNDTVSWTENFSEALTFTNVIVNEIGGGDDGGRPGYQHTDHYGRVVNPDSLPIKFSNLLSTLSSPTKPASDFEGKSMSEVFVLLNNSSITNFEELNTAILAYMTPIIMTSATADEIEGINIRIEDSASPGYTSSSGGFSYPVYSEFETTGLRNSTRVRPTLFIRASYLKYTLPTWWDPNAPGKITHTVTKTLMEVLAELEPGQAFKWNPDANYNFTSINFTTINTWGDLAIAMGYYMEGFGSGAGGGEIMPQMNELIMALTQNYPMSFQMEKPAGVPPDLEFDMMASGMYKDGAKVEQHNCNINEDTPFVSNEFTLKIIFAREATDEEKGTIGGGKGGTGGEEGGRKSIKFLKKI